jgi:hypothetical protein
VQLIWDQWRLVVLTLELLIFAVIWLYQNLRWKDFTSWTDFAWWNYRKGWVGYRLEREKRRYVKQWFKEDLKARWKLLAFSGRGAVQFILTVFFILLLFRYSFKQLGFLAPNDQNIKDFFGNLLQAHITVSGVALPILLFLVEKLQRDEEAIFPRYEVIIRESWLLPGIVFSLVGAIQISIDYFLLPLDAYALAFDSIVFIATVGFLLLAIYQTLRLSFDRGLLKDKGQKLVREKVAVSTQKSIDTRLADGILYSGLTALGITRYPGGVDRDARQRFHVLDAVRTGIIRDINLFGIEELIQHLKILIPAKKASSIASDAELQSPETDRQDLIPSESKLYIAKTIGALVTEIDTGLMLFERGSVEVFEELNKDYWVTRIFTIENYQ